MRTIEQNKEAIINFREALLDDEVLYNAFLASIESALKGSSPTDSMATRCERGSGSFQEADLDL